MPVPHPPLTTTWAVDQAAVAYYRQLAGLTQGELGARMGRSQSLIAEIERGAFRPRSLRIVSRLATALGVDIDKIAAPAEAVA